MSLSDRFRADLAKALKGRQAARTGVLRMLLASVKNAEIEKRGALSEDDLAAQVRRAIKLRKETIDAAVKGGRDDVRQREEAELRILEEYLPTQMSDEELDALVSAAIAEAGAAKPSDVGKVMKALMPGLAGRADGNRASGAVRKRLSGGA